jgi:hypothetical protein
LTSTRQIFGWRNAKLAARKKAIEKRTKGNEDMTRKNSQKNGLKGHSCLLLENGIPHSILKWRGGSLVLMPRKDAENNLKRKTIRK